KMYLLWFGQVRAPAYDNVAVVVMLHDPLLHYFFHGIHLPGRQKIAVGQSFQAIVIAADACKTLYISIPRRHIVVPDGPVYRITIPRGPLKIKFAPALRLPGPKQRLAAHLVTAYPIKRFLLYIRVLFILYKKVLRAFVKCITTVHHRVVLFYF